MKYGTSKKMTIIYGVDTEKEITPVMVRDAIVECFFQAHCEDDELAGAVEGVERSYCGKIVQKAFEDSQGDFEHPTKESILGALDLLKEFSKNFRSMEVIEKHQKEIKKLVDLLK